MRIAISLNCLWLDRLKIATIKKNLLWFLFVIFAWSWFRWIIVYDSNIFYCLLFLLQNIKQNELLKDKQFFGCWLILCDRRWSVCISTKHWPFDAEISRMRFCLMVERGSWHVNKGLTKSGQLSIDPSMQENLNQGIVW